MWILTKLLSDQLQAFSKNKFKTVGKGMELGLAIVHQIVVEKHGGTMLLLRFFVTRHARFPNRFIESNRIAGDFL
ncbi:hypothetical protein RIVM261_043300 [Rivularia sp. IAM M-261]|jgi:hypothetical protein|nr:hypothetical protein CAL7716_083640 [Calothrix sp. PCC 7716]GJD19374.1 hypothetical protein RIVM261_043300 [Rivularia sp. IAM M-261]